MKYKRLISCAFFALLPALTSGCGQSLTGDRNNSPTNNNANNNNNGGAAIKTDPPNRDDDVPIPKSLPSNIFANDLESPSLSGEAFTRDYARAVQSALPSTKVTIEKPFLVYIKVTASNREATKIDLTKMWLKCKDQPGKRQTTIAPSVEAIYKMTNFVDQPLAGEEFVDKIVPLVRDEKFVQTTIAGRMKNGKCDAYYDKLFNGLYIVYGIDDPSGIRILDQYYVQSRAHIAPSEVHAHALQNLERMVSNKIEIKADGPIFKVTTESNYEPSLILSDKILRRLSESVKGRLVISIPNNAELLICGDETKGALAKLKQETEAAAGRGALPISQKLYIRDQGSWKVFTAFES